jgi:xylulose-5-phosphate/fructose-6-phosphate phosphoketolase
LFDVTGALQPEMRVLAPTGERRISANPHANGGLLLRDLDLPAFPDYAVAVEKPGIGTAEATRVLGTFLRDVIARNPDHFRIMGPDETASNRLNAVFEATNKVGWPTPSPPMKPTPPAAGSSKCSPSICARAGSRVIY